MDTVWNISHTLKAQMIVSAYTYKYKYSQARYLNFNFTKWVQETKSAQSLEDA